jgi:hypothetical protein
MFDDERVFDFCIRHGINIEQYALMYFLMRKDFGKGLAQSQAKRYVEKFGKFSGELIGDLLERGFVDDLNSPGENLPEFYVVSDKVQALFAQEEEAEQLWNAYPRTFEFYSNGAQNNFIARHAGVYGTKEAFCEAYTRKIRRSKRKHDEVMEMVSKICAIGKCRKNQFNETWRLGCQ